VKPDHPRYLPRLAVSLGDPAGIGPEVILKALSDPTISQSYHLTVIGNLSLLKMTYQQLGLEDLADPENVSVLDIPIDSKIIQQITLGQGNAASGEASFIFLQEAIARTLKGEFDAIVTAPIAKSLWKLAGYHYPGQTEVLAESCGSKKYGMLFVAKSPYTGWTLRTLLATTHIPLREVADSLNPQLMSLKLELLVKCLINNFQIKHPKIMISGLNPHSGENGQLGTEEKDWLETWLKNEQKNYPDVELIGLIPPDTLWVSPGQAWFGHSQPHSLADGYLALYHDQGLIPVKLMAFDCAINTTIGLPFIRTSPDHGTAFDIARKGIAKANSMKEAIKLAAQLRSVRECFNEQ
jgi:4-hydroxythreonine-4-phosphate dehydrogenase